jgi:hypothetical protein
MHCSLHIISGTILRNKTLPSLLNVYVLRYIESGLDFNNILPCKP